MGTTQHGDGTTEHGAGIWGMGDLASDGYNVYVALDWHHQDAILGSNRNGAFTTTNWSAACRAAVIPSRVPSAPRAWAIRTASRAIWSIRPTRASLSAFLPGCTRPSSRRIKCTFAFPGTIQPPTTQINLLSKFTKALSNDWTLTVHGFGVRLERAADRRHDASAMPSTTPARNRARSSTSRSRPASCSGTVGVSGDLAAGNLAAQSRPGRPQNLVYSFPDIGPYQVDVDTITYRLFGDLHGTAAGWDIDSQVGVMYASMTQKMFRSLIPSLAQTDINNGTYVPGVSTNGQALFAPEDSDHPSSTLGVIDVHGARDIFDMPGGPRRC